MNGQQVWRRFIHERDANGACIGSHSTTTARDKSGIVLSPEGVEGTAVPEGKVKASGAEVPPRLVPLPLVRNRGSMER